MRRLILLLAFTMAAALSRESPAQALGGEGDAVVVHDAYGSGALLIWYRENNSRSSSRATEYASRMRTDGSLRKIGMPDILPPLFAYWRNHAFCFNESLFVNELLVDPEDRPLPRIQEGLHVPFFQGDETTSRTLSKSLERLYEARSAYAPSEFLPVVRVDDYVMIAFRVNSTPVVYSLPGHEVRSQLKGSKTLYGTRLTKRDEEYRDAFMEVLLTAASMANQKGVRHLEEQPVYTIRYSR